MGFCSQIKALLRKEFILSKRNPGRTVFEFLLPLMFVALLVVMKLVYKSDNIQAGPIYSQATVVGVSATTNLTILGNLLNYGILFTSIFKFASMEVGIVHSDNDFANEVYRHLSSLSFPVHEFSSESDMLAYAKKPKEKNDTKSKNLTTGITFNKQSNNEYDYTLYLDRDLIQDMSNNFADPLIM